MINCNLVLQISLKICPIQFINGQIINYTAVNPFNSNPMLDQKENQHQSSHTPKLNLSSGSIYQLKGQIQNFNVAQNIKRHELAKTKTYQNISDLAIQYKLSIQYSPALGIYLLPQIDDFFTWQFYIFLRQGYYKDSKVKGSILFDREQHKKIEEVRFISPVFHPLVNFNTGEIDLTKLIDSKTYSNDKDIFNLLMLLKQMFTNEQFFMIKDSFNLQASKIYQKSQTLFIEKVFETTVIPSDSIIFESELSQIIQLQENLQLLKDEQKIIERMKENLKIVCPASVDCLDSISKEASNKQDQSIESKVEQYMNILMSQEKFD